MYLLHEHTTQSTLSPDHICKVRELNPIFFPLPPPILMLTFSFELYVHLPKLSGFSFHECPFYKKWEVVQEKLLSNNGLPLKISNSFK